VAQPAKNAQGRPRNKKSDVFIGVILRGEDLKQILLNRVSGNATNGPNRRTRVMRMSGDWSDDP
jgi:hypothetical protein